MGDNNGKKHDVKLIIKTLLIAILHWRSNANHSRVRWKPMPVQSENSHFTSHPKLFQINLMIQHRQ